MLHEDRYCATCASPLVVLEIQQRARPVCKACGRVVYYDPKITVAAIVEKGGKVLLVRRATEPGLGLWSLPGGYVDRGEVVEEAAAREVQEETGLRVKVEHLVGLFSEAGQTVVLAAYDTTLIDGRLAPGPEAMEVSFFTPARLPPLAFPRDSHILDAWQHIRSTNQI